MDAGMYREILRALSDTEDHTRFRAYGEDTLRLYIAQYQGDGLIKGGISKPFAAEAPLRNMTRLTRKGYEFLGLPIPENLPPD